MYNESIAALIHPEREWNVEAGDSSAIDGGLGVFLHGKGEPRIFYHLTT